MTDREELRLVITINAEAENVRAEPVPKEKIPEDTEPTEGRVSNQHGAVGFPQRSSEGSSRQYPQQMVGGRPVYVQGAVPPQPMNAARGRGIRRREPSDYSFDDDGPFVNTFSTREIRHRFIRKVYLILAVLLTFTAGVVGLFVFESHVRSFAQENFFVGYGIFLAGMVFYFILACFQAARKNFPINFILLCIYTICSAIGYGTIATLYAPELVLYSAAITAGVCIVITILACQTWIDITGCGMFLCIVGTVVSIFGLIVMILAFTTGISRILYMVYSAIIALVMCMYFMYTTQLILGGKKYEMSEEEYVLGAIVLYTEIMTLFMVILQLFGGARSN